MTDATERAKVYHVWTANPEMPICQQMRKNKRKG